MITLTRSQFILLIAVVLLLVPAVAIAGHSAYRDARFNPHEAAIHWISDAGITSGCTQDKFCSADPVSRAQLATLLYRLSGNSPSIPPSVNADKLDGIDSAGLITGVRTVTQQATVPAGGFLKVSANCNDKETVLGGGFENASDVRATFFGSSPKASPAGWQVTALGPDKVDVPVVAFALCATQAG